MFEVVKMKKKIIVLGIITLLLIVGLSSATVMSQLTMEKESEKIFETKNAKITKIFFGKARYEDGGVPLVLYVNLDGKPSFPYHGRGMFGWFFTGNMVAEVDTDITLKIKGDYGQGAGTVTIRVQAGLFQHIDETIILS